MALDRSALLELTEALGQRRWRSADALGWKGARMLVRDFGTVVRRLGGTSSSIAGSSMRPAASIAAIVILLCLVG